MINEEPDSRPTFDQIQVIFIIPMCRISSNPTRTNLRMASPSMYFKCPTKHPSKGTHFNQWLHPHKWCRIVSHLRWPIRDQWPAFHNQCHSRSRVPTSHSTDIYHLEIWHRVVWVCYANLFSHVLTAPFPISSTVNDSSIALLTRYLQYL